MQENIITKLYITPLYEAHQTGGLAILFGALVGGVRNVIKNGWQGWVKFLLNMLVNIFVGLVAYLLAQDWGLTGLKPIILALVFGSLGEKGWEVLLKYVFDFIDFQRGKK